MRPTDRWKGGDKRGMSVQCANPRLFQCLPHGHTWAWGSSPGDQEHSRTLIWKPQLCGRQYSGGVPTSQTGRGQSSCLCF